MTAVQTSIEAAFSANVDAVVFVKEPSCGERYFTRGPSKYPITTGHLIASNTKTYVASLILLLADDGLLKLDDPISKWIDGVPGGNAISIRQTLNHSSGLYNYTNDFGFLLQVGTGKKYTPEQLIDIGFKGKTYFAPGAGFHYSNTNYVILGRIAEKAASLPLEQQIRARILDPMRAKSTFFPGKETVTIDVATGISALGGTAIAWDPSATWAAGAMVATVDELGRWAERRGSKAFHSDSASRALFEVIVAEPGRSRYGAGLLEFLPVLTAGGGSAFGHTGDIPGYHSWSIYLPDKKTTAVGVVDRDPGPFDAPYSSTLLNAVVGALFGGTPAGGAPSSVAE